MQKVLGVYFFDSHCMWTNSWQQLHFVARLVLIFYTGECKVRWQVECWLYSVCAQHRMHLCKRFWHHKLTCVYNACEWITDVRLIVVRAWDIWQQVRHSIHQLENVAIVMHCNLRPPDAVPVVIRFNYDTNTKVQVEQPVHSCSIVIFLLLRYVTLWPWPLTWNIYSVSSVIVCDVTKTCTKF